MEIAKLELNSQEALALNTLLNKEWPDVGEFENEKFGVSVPKPIAAIESGKVVGGLSFTCYKEPSGTEIVVWVNAVYVIPNYRHQGIATKLILSSCDSACRLYALTDVSALYTNVGWEIVSKDSNGAVVKYYEKE